MARCQREEDALVDRPPQAAALLQDRFAPLPPEHPITPVVAEAAVVRGRIPKVARPALGTYVVVDELGDASMGIGRTRSHTRCRGQDSRACAQAFWSSARCS